MNFNIFKTKQKSPHDLVKHVKDSVHKLDGNDKRKVNVSRVFVCSIFVFFTYFFRQQTKFQNIWQ
jgi:hypothetical protein